MLALAGIIGPGLLVGAGGALHQGGPAPLLIGFGVIGIIAFSIMQSLGEMTTLYPSGGAFTKLADRFVARAVGAAVGWNYFIIWAAVLANEYNAICSIFNFWSDKVPLWGYFLLFWFFFLGFQLLGVEAFGEAEFWLALVQLAGLVAAIVFSIIYAAGGLKGQTEPLGFRYWHHAGAFTAVLPRSIAVAATETKNPSVAVPLAIRQVFWRILFIYMGSAFFFGLTCPANSAPFSEAARALQNAGWYGGVHLINAFIFVTCLSAINSSIYIGSRTVLFMAQDGKAPAILGKTNKRGVPTAAIVFTNLFGALSMMNVSTGAATAYTYIVNLSGVSTFLVWGAISFIHIRFRSAWAVRGRGVEDLPYRSWLYPYNAWFGLGANIFLALIQGWTTLAPFTAGTFVDAYILPVLLQVIFGVFKWVNKTEWQKIEDVDLDHGRRADVDIASVEDENTVDTGKG
ncbi:hypothetical protein VE04_05336, partial [Pseudogymnoascus sp. 24MN13]